MKKYEYKHTYMRYIFMIVAIIVGAIVCNNASLVASTSYYENWNVLSPTTRILENEHYYVKDNVEMHGSDGESGLVIKGDVSLYIAEGKSLTVSGGMGSDISKASGAGIELDEGATLRIYGKGNIRANGANGRILANVAQRNEETISLSFGAGAGIGGKGGILERAESNKSITMTTALYPQAMGNLYIYDQVNIIATAGQGEDVGAGTANIGKGGGSEETNISRGVMYVAKSAKISDIMGTSKQALRTSATWVDMSVISIDNQGGVGEISMYGLSQTQLHSITSIPIKEGYQFLGYYSEANGAGVMYIDALGNHTNALWNPASTTLYAAWSAKTYTLSLLQDGVDRITIDGMSPNSNGTYTVPYGMDITVRAQSAKGKKFVGWYSDADITSHNESFTFKVLARDMKLHAIATNKGIETPEIIESNAKPRSSSASIQVQVNGIQKDMGVISLVSEQGNILTPSGKNGNYTYTKTIDYDKEPYEVRIDGKRSGKYVSFDQEGTTNTTINYHEINIHVTLNGKPSDLGEIQFINKNDPNDHFQVFYNPTLNYAQYYALENKEDVYQLKVAGQWMSEEIRLHEKRDIHLDLYRASLDIQLDNIAKNMGEITLRDENGTIKHTLHREEGIYQKIARDTKSYWIYVDGVNTNKTMPFASDQKLRYYTVSYEVTNPDVRGELPDKQVYLQGSKVRIGANNNLSRKYHTLLGWRNDRQFYELGSEIEIQKTMQFYDTWQRQDESKQQEDVSFWVDTFGFATLDEAVIATQMSNSKAFGRVNIEYRNTDTSKIHEIYGTLPNGYVLKGNQEQLIVPKGKTLTLGDKHSKDGAEAVLQDMNLLIDEGQLHIDGQHARLMQSKISLLPGNRIHLVSKLKEDSELKLECLDEIGKPAIMNISKKWKSNSLLVDSDVEKHSSMGHIAIENEGFSLVASQSEMGTQAYYAMDTKDVSAVIQRTLKDGRRLQTSYKAIQDAIDEENVGEKEIYVLKDSEEQITLHGNEPITLISAKQKIDPLTKQLMVEDDSASKTLSSELRIKDNRDGSGTIFRLQQMQIKKPIQLDVNSKVEVTEMKTWLPDEKIILHTTPTRDKEKRSMVINAQGNEAHFQLSNALLSQGYALYQEASEMGMKYYGKAIDILHELTNITSEDKEVYTLQFDVAYETGISDDISLSDAQYQELSYTWQRKQKGSSLWHDMDTTLSSVEYEEGIAHIRYTKLASTEDRNYVYRCLVNNKVNKATNTYITTREASVDILEEPSQFVKIPKQINMHQERRETKGNSEVEELSTTNEIVLMGENNPNVLYEVYTHPTFTLTQKNNVQGYVIQVWDEKKEPLEKNGLLMMLQTGTKESGQFYLYGSSEESQRVGVYRGVMTFQIQRTQK